jgi:hypothetical protein
VGLRVGQPMGRKKKKEVEVEVEVGLERQK